VIHQTEKDEEWTKISLHAEQQLRNTKVHSIKTISIINLKQIKYIGFSFSSEQNHLYLSFKPQFTRSSTTAQWLCNALY